MFRSPRERLVWFAITVLLGLQLRFDLLRVLDPGFQETFQEDSDRLVLATLGDPSQAWFHPLGAIVPDVHYNAQVGLQGIVMAAISPGQSLYGALRLATAVLLAAVVATAVVAAWRAWGGRAAGVFLSLLVLSTWITAFGHSTYWQLWTLLLPALVPLLVWPRLGSGRRKWLRGGLLVAGLVLLKALCGYEFITTVILASAAAVAFHEFRGRIDVRLALRLVAVCAWGLLGFVAALGVHMTQIFVMGDDFATFVRRVTNRTFSPMDMEARWAWVREGAANDPLANWLVAGDSPVGMWAYRLTGYLRNSGVALPGERPGVGFGASYPIPIWVFVVVFAVLVVLAWRGRISDAAVQRRLAVMGGVSLLGTMSWLTLGFGHMIAHPHIDAIVFYLPFLPVVFAMIAVRVATFSATFTRVPRAALEAIPHGEPATPAELPLPDRDLVTTGAGR